MVAPTQCIACAVYLTLRLTCKLGNETATRKLANQLRNPAKDIAGGRGPCLKSSAPMNCGMDPTNKDMMSLKTKQTLNFSQY